MTLADWAQAAKLIREAHRYCTFKEHGGHDFEECPMWRAFLGLTNRPENTRWLDAHSESSCPYCEGRMCARLDGLGCTHDRVERHGYGGSDATCVDEAVV